MTEQMCLALEFLSALIAGRQALSLHFGRPLWFGTWNAVNEGERVLLGPRAVGNFAGLLISWSPLQATADIDDRESNVAFLEC